MIFIDVRKQNPDTELGKLNQDLTQANPHEINIKALRKAIHHLKEDEKGVKIVSDLLAKRDERLRHETIHERNIEIAENLYLGGFDDEMILQYTKIMPEELRSIKEKYAND